MVAFNFQRQFVAAVEAGEKKQTIRALRKDDRSPCACGDNLQLYTGMRTKACRKIADAVCTDITCIELAIIGGDFRAFIETDTGTATLRGGRLNEFARSDGFEGAGDMFAWFEKVHSLPFKGWLIDWELEASVSVEEKP